jgi:signal transduction histidine kinase
MGDASWSHDRYRWTAAERALAGLAAVAVLGLGLAGAHRSRLLTLERRARDDTAVVASVATGMALDLVRGLDGVAAAAELASARGPAAATRLSARASIPAADQLGFVPADRGTGGSSSPLSAADLADDTVAALLDRTRDSGETVPSFPLDLRGEPRMLLVAPAYAHGEIHEPPTSVEDRRERLIGWVVAAVDLDALVQLRLPEGAVASVRVGSGSSSAPTATVPDRLPEQTVEVRGRAVTVTAGDPTDIGFATPTILFVVAGAAGALAVATAVLGSTRRLGRKRAALERHDRQVRLIGEVAPLVQQSLELDDVLPAVAVQLTDHFGLAGVRLSTGRGSSGQLELFSLGARAGRPPTPVLRPPGHLAAGEALTLALQRGGRSVALLELVAGRDLDDADLSSLRAVTELVTAAVVNASLYASQQTAVRRLRELDALKTTFLSTASHELRTPATAIGGFATLLSTSWDRFSDEQRRDFADRIAANARSLAAVVQDLLDFSLLDRAAVPLALTSVDLQRLVGEVIDRLSPMFADHVITCTATPAPPVAAEVNGLERIVTNLLTNAVKFSPAGTTVTVSVGASRGGAAVTVADEGPGVPLEERQRVFTRFFRGTGDAVVQTRGVGIGLSVVAELVTRMGGEITLDDAPGGGARFTVWLPGEAALGEEKETEDATTG